MTRVGFKACLLLLCWCMLIWFACVGLCCFLHVFVVDEGSLFGFVIWLFGLMMGIVDCGLFRWCMYLLFDCLC